MMPRMTRRTMTVGCLAAALIAVCACGAGPIVTYRLPGIVTVPLGSQVTDASVPFGQVFCATLTHLDPLHAQWGACRQYLETGVTEQPPASAVIPTDWRVLVVGGIFSHCFEQRQVYAFEQALEHLHTAHHLETRLLKVGSVDAPEENAKTIAEYLGKHPGKYIAIGHSKGAVDLMVALQNHKAAQDNIRALVSVAGAISGSRLVDFGTPATIAGFRKAIRNSGLGNCRITENGGVASMRRQTRNEFLRHWSPPSSLRAYSIVGVVDRDHTSKPIRAMWLLQSLYSIDQDSQLIAEEAVMPGARFLGIAKGDHWALALPLSEHPNPEIVRKVDHNRYPRIALLEAIVRYVISGS
jgi:hypothetical protein